MPRLNTQFLIGLFALITLLIAGAAISRILGLPVVDGMYLMLLVVAIIIWAISRRIFRKEH